MEKQYHCGKQKENGIKRSAEKSRASKNESSQKERPKATNKGSKKIEVEERRKERIKWLKANSKEWVSFDEDITNILKLVHSSHEKKAEAHPGIIFTAGSNRFGVKEAKPQPVGPSTRQKKCKKVREEIKLL